MAPDTVQYSAYPELSADTIAFVPYAAAGDLLRPPPRTHTLAVDQQRKAFYALAVQRIRNSPNQSDALEWLAEAMELRGEEGTIDTLRRARALSKTASQALRLAETEVWWQLKQSLPDNPKGLISARQLAESLVKHVRPSSREDAARLTGLAVLVGDGGDAARLARQSAEALPAIGVPASVMALGNAYLVFASIGGPVDSLRQSGAALSDAIDNQVVEARQAAARDMLLGRAASIAYPSYPALSITDGATQDYLLKAEVAHSRKDAKSVREILASVQRARAGTRASDVTFDAIFPEAWLLVAVGDTAVATRSIGLSLRAIGGVSSQVLSEWPNVGGLTHAIALYARLLINTGNPNARTWTTAMRALQLEHI